VQGKKVASGNHRGVREQCFGGVKTAQKTSTADVDWRSVVEGWEEFLFGALVEPTTVAIAMIERGDTEKRRQHIVLVSRLMHRSHIDQRPFALPNTVSPMDTEPHRQVPEITFRVLIIGRANAGKTSILQRVCETTESPFVYRETEEGIELVRSSNIFFLSDLMSDQVNLEPSIEVSDNSASLRLPLNMVLAGRAQYQR
jgi:hypothetical protein